MSVLQVLTALSALAAFGSFIWAIRKFFATSGEVPKGMKWINRAGMASLVAHMVFLWWPGHVFGVSAVLGLILYLAALVLFATAIKANLAKPLTLAYSEDRPTHLVRSGPYRFVRHPFYTSYLLAWIAGTIATRQPWLFLTVLGMGFLYYRAAAMEEKKFISGGFAAEYERYKESAGLFWPKFSRR